MGAREVGKKRLLSWKEGVYNSTFKGILVTANTTQMVFHIPNLLTITAVLEDDHLDFYLDHHALLIPNIQGFMGEWCYFFENRKSIHR